MESKKAELMKVAAILKQVVKHMPGKYFKGRIRYNSSEGLLQIGDEFYCEYYPEKVDPARPKRSRALSEFEIWTVVQYGGDYHNPPGADEVRVCVAHNAYDLCHKFILALVTDKLNGIIEFVSLKDHTEI